MTAKRVRARKPPLRARHVTSLKVIEASLRMAFFGGEFLCQVISRVRERARPIGSENLFSKRQIIVACYHRAAAVRYGPRTPEMVRGQITRHAGWERWSRASVLRRQ